MNKLVALFVIGPLVWVNMAYSSSVENGNPKPPIKLSLEAINKTVMSGAVPKFRLTIKNQFKDPERVIDLRGGRRNDLQDTYYDLEVEHDGKPVSLPRAISDPGPISKEDFLTLKPGEHVTFELSRFALALEQLSPGKYKARVRFWKDPSKPSKSSLFSPYAEFTVSK